MFNNNNNVILDGLHELHSVSVSVRTLLLSHNHIVMMKVPPCHAGRLQHRSRWCPGLCPPLATWLWWKMFLKIRSLFFNEITFPWYQARLGRPLLSHLQPSLLDDRDCFCKDLKPAHQFHNLFVFVVTLLCNPRNVLKWQVYVSLHFNFISATSQKKSWFKRSLSVFAGF